MTKKERRLERMKRILGRDTQLPKSLAKSDFLSCGIAHPADVLARAGYRDTGRGWTRDIGSGERYHAFPFTEEKPVAGGQTAEKPYICIHRDITVKGMHVATRDVLDEKIRLKEFIVPEERRPKQKRRLKDEWLPREEMLKALERLRIENSAGKSAIRDGAHRKPRRGFLENITGIFKKMTNRKVLQDNRMNMIREFLMKRLGR